MTKKLTNKQYKALQKANPQPEPEAPKGYIKTNQKDLHRLLSFVASSNTYFQSLQQEGSLADSATMIGRLYSNMKVIQKVVQALEVDSSEGLLEEMTNESDVLVTRFRHLLNERDLTAVEDEARELAAYIQATMDEMVGDGNIIEMTTETSVLTPDEAKEAADKLTKSIEGNGCPI